jgi:hypothetical protein
MMLKRNISVLVAGVLLGGQIGLAAADQSAAPLGAEAIVSKTEPTIQTTYRDQHAASNPASPNGNVFPPSAQEERTRPLPAQARYFEEHVPVHRATAADGVFPPSADDLYSQPLPAQARYLEQKAERVRTAEQTGQGSTAAN